jgi:hypothetical protein
MRLFQFAIKVLDEGEPSKFQQFTNLLDVIIWPLTVFLCLLLFKNQIAKIIGSLGSIKAGTDGIELNFIEEKLQEATKIIGIGPGGIKAKGSGRIKPKGMTSIKPKGSESIKPKGDTSIMPDSFPDSGKPKQSHAETPYQELIGLQDSLNQELNDYASHHKISVSGTSNFTLTNELVDHEIISSHVGRQLKTLIELFAISLNSPNITYDHVSQIRKLYNNITLS